MEPLAKRKPDNAVDDKMTAWEHARKAMGKAIQDLELETEVQHRVPDPESAPHGPDPVGRSQDPGHRLQLRIDQRCFTDRAPAENKLAGFACVGGLLLTGLSAPDGRHYWATKAARNGRPPIDRLQDTGGWASPAMPLRYVEAAKIASECVQLHLSRADAGRYTVLS